MVDIVLSTDDVTVLGGPSQISVDVGTGPTGERGSLIFQGDADPNTLTAGDFVEAPKVFDLFLVVDPSDENYLQFYQYVSRDGGNTWEKVLKLTESSYAVSKVLDFVAGEASVDINLFELNELGLVLNTVLDSYANFSTQVTLSNSGLPSAVSVATSDVFSGPPESDPSGDYVNYLPLTINAVEWNGASWADIDGKSVVAHIAISIVDPTEVLEAGGI